MLKAITRQISFKTINEIGRGIYNMSQQQSFIYVCLLTDKGPLKKTVKAKLNN